MLDQYEKGNCNPNLVWIKQIQDQIAKIQIAMEEENTQAGNPSGDGFLNRNVLDFRNFMF